MKTKAKCIEFLTSKGYIFNGQNITAPDTNSPLEAISIQDELEEISDCKFTLQYIGDNLRLVAV